MKVKIPSTCCLYYLISLCLHLCFVYRPNVVIIISKSYCKFHTQPGYCLQGVPKKTIPVFSNQVFKE